MKNFSFLLGIVALSLIDPSSGFTWPWKKTDGEAHEHGNGAENGGAKDVTQQTNVPVDALHAAAARGDTRELETLLSDNFDINTKDQNGWQAIHEAVKFGDVGVVKFLVDHGSEVGSKTEVGGTALWWSVHQYGEDHPVTTYLRSVGAPLEGGDFSEEVVMEGDETDGSTELHLYASEGNVAAAKEVLRQHHHLLNSVDVNGWQPLHEAVQTGEVEMVKFLVQKGAELNSKIVSGGTPLWWSRRAFGSNHAVTTYLESVGALDEGDNNS